MCGQELEWSFNNESSSEMGEKKKKKGTEKYFSDWLKLSIHVVLSYQWHHDDHMTNNIATNNKQQLAEHSVSLQLRFQQCSLVLCFKEPSCSAPLLAQTRKLTHHALLKTAPYDSCHRKTRCVRFNIDFHTTLRRWIRPKNNFKHESVITF